MCNLSRYEDFGDLWQKMYEELCVLECQVCGLSQDYLPDSLQFGLHVQVNRLFTIHDQIFEVVKKENLKEPEM